MTEFTNGLSPAQAERLALLAEELAEAIQVVGKVLRHGYDSRNPLDRNSATNRTLLEVEIGHVLAAIQLAADANDIQRGWIGQEQDAKLRTVRRWLHHQSEAAATTHLKWAR